MRTTLTISLPWELRKRISREAKRRKLSKSEFVRRALLNQLWEDAFDETRRALLPRAWTKGFYADEDVFRLVS